MKLITLAALSLSLIAAQPVRAEDEMEAPAKVRHHGDGAREGQARQFNRNAGAAREAGNPQRQFNAQQQIRSGPLNTSPNVTPRIYNQPNVSRRVIREPRVNPVITPVAPAIAGQPVEVGQGRRWRNGGGDGAVFGVDRRNWRGNNDNDNRNDDWRNRVGNSGDGDRAQNWSGRRHGHWDRNHRDRSWWRSHYNRFARFGGGYYYLNSGYWYPAYGYDPYFTTYSYDAPIYAYNDQEPGQVIASVQAELQRRGYNAGGVDGTYGPQTRRALLNYQADTGLATTGEIDEQTLDSLGLE